MEGKILRFPIQANELVGEVEGTITGVTLTKVGINLRVKLDDGREIVERYAIKNSEEGQAE